MLLLLSGVTAVYLGSWAKAIFAARQRPDPSPSSPFDATLGIGSFAPTAAFFKLRKMVDDRLIPGTLNVGHTVGATVQTFLFTTLIRVEIATLFSMILAAVLGAWLGAGIVAGFSKRKVQIGMGSALLVAASLFLMTQLNLFPVGGEALGVSGIRFVIAVTINFILGSLMTLGIGMYAPCMILVSLLGMNPTAAFPIMMGSCAFLMPVGSMKFIRLNSFAMRPALGLLIGSWAGVALAFLFFQSLSLYYVRWLVIIVVSYTSISMLRSAFVESAARKEAIEVA
jgi:uncharacterized membrane protein YfcA